MTLLEPDMTPEERKVAYNNMLDYAKKYLQKAIKFTDIKILRKDLTDIVRDIEDMKIERVK